MSCKLTFWPILLRKVCHEMAELIWMNVVKQKNTRRSWCLWKVLPHYLWGRADWTHETSEFLLRTFGPHTGTTNSRMVSRTANCTEEFLDNGATCNTTSKQENFFHRLKTHTTYHDVSKATAVFFMRTQLNNKVLACSSEEENRSFRNVVACVLRRWKMSSCLLVMCCRLANHYTTVYVHSMHITDLIRIWKAAKAWIWPRPMSFDF